MSNGLKKHVNLWLENYLKADSSLMLSSSYFPSSLFASQKPRGIPGGPYISLAHSDSLNNTHRATLGPSYSREYESRVLKGE